MQGRRPKTPPPPLDREGLERLAIAYVGRFATSRGRLADYLRRKLRERGWAGEGAPDPVALAERMAARGYLDDAAYAEAKAAALGGRGLGPRRVSVALRAAGIGEADGAGARAAAEDGATAAALRFARRRRIGPFSQGLADEALRRRQAAAMMRAGHGPRLVWRIVRAGPGETIEDERPDIEDDAPDRD